MSVRYPELGYYALPGHVFDPREIADEVRTGESLGLGSVWISERHNTKNVEVLSGAAPYASSLVSRSTSSISGSEIEGMAAGGSGLTSGV